MISNITSQINFSYQRDSMYLQRSIILEISYKGVTKIAERFRWLWERNRCRDYERTTEGTKALILGKLYSSALAVILLATA